MEARRTARSASLGYVVVLIGAIGFVISCFLPYTEYFVLNGGRSLSFFRVMTIQRSAMADVGWYLNLFGGVVVLVIVSARGLLRPRSWTVPALVVGSSVWSLTWLGLLLGQNGLFTDLRIGYWLLILSAIVVIIGGVLAALSARRGRVEDRSESEPAPALRP